MTDSMFEQSLDRQIRAYADAGVQPFDRYAIAEDLIKSGVPRRRFLWLPAFGRPILSPSLAIIVIGLLLALLAAFVAGALLLRMQLNQPPGRNGVIAYTVMDIAERPYNHLRIVNPDGTGDREVAQGTAPIYSADGDTLTYFTGWGIDESNLELVQAKADGSEPRTISAYRQTGFYPSPDGLQILMRPPDGEFFRDQGLRREWVLLRAADATHRHLLDPPADGLTYSDFRWSPDGSQIAYAVMQEVTTADNGGSYRAAIDIVDVVSSEVRRLTSRAGTDSATLAWSPDGRYIAYAGIPDGTPLPSLEPGGDFYPPMDIFLIKADGSGDTNLTVSSGNNQFPAWAPDGTAISYDEFVDSDEPGFHVIVQPMAGHEVAGEPVVGPDGLNAESLVWSPDAMRIAYARVTDVTPPGSDTQVLHSVIQTVDRSFDDEPFTVAEVDYGVGSLTWQWLKP